MLVQGFISMFSFCLGIGWKKEEHSSEKISHTIAYEYHIILSVYKTATATGNAYLLPLSDRLNCITFI
jgi:hypothetical protein